jgi:hypothetical protein
MDTAWGFIFEIRSSEVQPVPLCAWYPIYLTHVCENGLDEIKRFFSILGAFYGRKRAVILLVYLSA